MNSWTILVLYLVQVLCISMRGTLCIEPITIGAAGGMVLISVLLTGWNQMTCSIGECCTEPWIKNNLSWLEESLDSKLHGQHIAKQVVVKALKTHIAKADPQKALVISLHGWTGGGKTFVSKYIPDSIYVNGNRSKFVHFFMGSYNFPIHEEADVYKLHLQDWIRSNVSQCEQSMFIFDEVDKMPGSILDGIKPFIDYHNYIDNTNFRKSIYILLSNSGGHAITKKILELYKLNYTRHDLTMEHFENLLQESAFNEEGGLHHSDLVRSQLIDHYVPFLPLEETHIISCAKDAFHSRGLFPSYEVLQKIASQMNYVPNETPLFSTSGCKHVTQKVEMFIQEHLK